MKISYLITCSNETDTLDRLLSLVTSAIGNDEIIILMDSDNYSDETSHIVHKHYSMNTEGSIIIMKNSLNNNYGGHKNQGIQQCKGQFIFQIDGDELPPENLLGENLHAFIDGNPTIEAFAVPRINDFRGVTPESAKPWGWKLTQSPTYNRPIVNFPDFQFRIFKNDYPRISFTRRLHEKIEGYSTFVVIPPDEEYAIYHDKTIEKQVETNIRYNKAFTQQENKGHSVFK